MKNKTHSVLDKEQIEFIKALTDEAYEGAAQVCENEAKMHRSAGNHGASGNLLNAASAIRALKG